MVYKELSHVLYCTFASTAYHFLITSSQLLETVQEATNNLEERGHSELKMEK